MYTVVFFEQMWKYIKDTICKNGKNMNVLTKRIVFPVQET